MNSMEFTQVIPRLRVLETRLLDKAKIDRMIDGDSANEALKVLQESEYANVMTGVKRAEDYEIILSKELKRVYELMYDASPSKALIDLMSIKYDYHNIKVLLKGMFLQKDFSEMLISVGKIDIHTLKQSINNNSLGELPKVMREAIEKAKNHKGQPTAIVCKTVKGKGVSFMENEASWHGTAPSREQCEKALEEIGGDK